MVLQEDYEDLSMVLTSEETDKLFDPFDSCDSTMPSHLYHTRHRFIKEDPYEWLVENVGQPQIDWSHYGYNLDQRAIRFRDRTKAMLFKLTFGGA